MREKLISWIPGKFAHIVKYGWFLLR